MFMVELGNHQKKDDLKQEIINIFP